VRELSSPRGLLGTLGVTAGATGFAPPDVQLVRKGTRGSEREVTLRLLKGDAYALRLRVPADRLVGWSLAEAMPQPPALPALPARATHYEARFVSAPDTGWVVTLHVRGAAPVGVDVGAVRSDATPAARSLLRALPPWATGNALAVDWRTVEF